MANYAAPGTMQAPPAGPAGEVVDVEVTAVAVEVPTLDQRIRYVEAFLEETYEQRRDSMRDRDFYDGHQLSKDDLAKLKRRKQPALVHNLIAPKVNYVLGEEVMRRTDPVALPRTMQHDSAARAATDALRFVSDEEGFDVARTAMAKNMFVEGTGGVIKELVEGPDRVRHKLRHVEWDRLIWDPHSRSLLFEDAKYLGVHVWLDLDDAVIDYPHAAEALESAVMNPIAADDEGTSDRPRYSWVDAKRKRVQIAELYIRIGDTWVKTCFTQAADLEEPGETGYRDEQGKSICPLKMASCYIDREGRRYGVVRHMVSPQMALNKHKSKLLHMVTAKPVMAERDAVRDPQEFMQEVAKPDGFGTIEPGFFEKVKVIDQTSLATAHLQLVQESKADIQGIGPTASQVPGMPASSSGRALLARQKAASQELGNPFDTIRQWTKSVFELDWHCIRQHWTEEMWLRVTDDETRTGYRFVALNRRMTRAQRMGELMQQGLKPDAALDIAAGTYAWQIRGDVQRQMAMMPPQVAQQMKPEQLIMAHPAMQDVITENQVDQMVMDIVIDESPETAVIQQEEFDKLIELAGMVVPTNPSMGPMMTKLVVRASQLRDKKELLEMMDKPPDPQQVQAQQAMRQLQLEQGKAGVAVAQSQAQLNQARAAAEATKTQHAGAKLPSEIKKNEASAYHDAANAGHIIGGPGPQGVLPWGS